MAYTDAATVMELAPMLGTLTASTRVTSSGLSRMIGAIEAEIDVALAAQGYTVPYTDGGAFLTWLQKLATDGAAARLYKAWFMDTSGGASQGQGSQLFASYMAGLKAIRDRSMVPVAIAEGGGSLPRGFDSANAAAVFTMTTEF